ncbi:MAG: hypothetical protein KDE47_07565 [Caldilineaceae bacterium]|nr:hypothetical protein [Caldilineaceae bacterium]
MIQHPTAAPIQFSNEPAALWSDFGAATQRIEEADTKASVPAIMLASTLSILLAALGFVMARLALHMTPLPSAGIAGISLMLMMGPSAVLASALTGSPAIGRNLGFSCGLIFLTLLFFAGCGMLGGVGALLFMMTEISVVRG